MKRYVFFGLILLFAILWSVFFPPFTVFFPISLLAFSAWKRQPNLSHSALSCLRMLSTIFWLWAWAALVFFVSPFGSISFFPPWWTFLSASFVVALLGEDFFQTPIFLFIRKWLVHIFWDFPLLPFYFLWQSVHWPLNCCCSRIADHVFLGSAPLTSFAVSELRRNNIVAIVNLCYELPPSMQKKILRLEMSGMEQLHLPLVDLTVPSIEVIDKAVNFVSSHVAKSHNVLIHCKSGMSRGAIVSLCYLLASVPPSSLPTSPDPLASLSLTITPQQAYLMLSRARPEVEPSLLEQSVVYNWRDLVEQRKQQQHQGCIRPANQQRE